MRCGQSCPKQQRPRCARPPPPLCHNVPPPQSCPLPFPFTGASSQATPDAGDDTGGASDAGTLVPTRANASSETRAARRGRGRAQGGRSGGRGGACSGCGSLGRGHSPHHSPLTPHPSSLSPRLTSPLTLTPHPSSLIPSPRPLTQRSSLQRHRHLSRSSQCNNLMVFLAWPR